MTGRPVLASICLRALPAMPPPALGDFSARLQALGLDLVRDLRRGGLGQHIEHQFEVAHVVAQIFFLQIFQILVFSGRHIGPSF